VAPCRGSVRAPSGAPPGKPDSMGLSLEGSLRADPASACDVTGRCWSRCASERLGLGGEVFLRGCLRLPGREAECPSMEPTAGSACAGTVRGWLGI